jgi:hypothetical protein
MVNGKWLMGDRFPFGVGESHRSARMVPGELALTKTCERPLASHQRRARLGVTTRRAG